MIDWGQTTLTMNVEKESTAYIVKPQKTDSVPKESVFLLKY